MPALSIAGREAIETAARQLGDVEFGLESLSSTEQRRITEVLGPLCVTLGTMDGGAQESQKAARRT